MIGNSNNPVEITFEDVVATNYGSLPFTGYKCENVNGKAIGTTDPIPPCFNKEITEKWIFWLYFFNFYFIFLSRYKI